MLPAARFSSGTQNQLPLSIVSSGCSLSPLFSLCSLIIIFLSTIGVDIDGDLVDLCRKHLKYCPEEMYNEPRLTFAAQDCRVFFDEAKRRGVKYDCIILDLCDPDVDDLIELEAEAEAKAPPPQSADEQDLDYNLHGLRFWKEISSLLTSEGAICTHTGPIFPGSTDRLRRPGQWWTKRMGKECELGEGSTFKVCIPSFQGEWGYWMSTSPKLEEGGSADASFPRDCRVMDDDVQKIAFKWPKFYGEDGI